jgi:hypothetical protein
MLGGKLMKCKYYNCDKPTTSAKSEICKTHYSAEWKLKNPEKIKAQRERYYEKNKEAIANANAKWKANNIDVVRGYARNYMAKNAKNPVTQEHMTDSVKERFFAKVEKTDTCWNWTGARSAYRPKRIIAGATQGYGVISINNRPFYVHRASWLMHNGPLIQGLVIDHLCENTLCVNPDHMQQVTNDENTKRSDKHSSKTKYFRQHCKNGHVRTEEMRGKACFECYPPKKGIKTHCKRGHVRTPDLKGKKCPKCYHEDLLKARLKRQHGV